MLSGWRVAHARQLSPCVRGFMQDNDTLYAGANDNDAPEKLTIDDLTLDEALPEKNEAAIAAVREQEEKQKQEQAQEPAPYGYTKAGKPAKKRGRKTGNTPEFKPLNLGDSAMPHSVESQSMAAAVTTSALLEHMQVAMISPDFKYSDAERALNVHAWCKTFDHYGGVKMHPAVELAMSHASIIATRASNSSDTKTKLALAGAWLKSKFKRKGKKDARFDSRPDAERQDNLRREES